MPKTPRADGAFYLLPGVWEEGEFYDMVWTQVRRQLECGGELNQSERRVLLELLNRIASRPAARKALGIRGRPRTAERNERMADLFIRLHMIEGQSRDAAAAAVMRAHPTVGEATVRAVLESNRWLAPARTRLVVTYMVNNEITDSSVTVLLKRIAAKHKKVP
jgi:hypothetical protein